MMTCTFGKNTGSFNLSHTVRHSLVYQNTACTYTTSSLASNQMQNCSPPPETISADAIPSNDIQRNLPLFEIQDCVEASAVKDAPTSSIPDKEDSDVKSDENQFDFPVASVRDTFPTKLYKILSKSVFVDVISWLPHGRSWRVLDQERFETEVLPLYFRHGNFMSFMRQVNAWGFRRTYEDFKHNSFYHEVRL